MAAYADLAAMAARFSERELCELTLLEGVIDEDSAIDEAVLQTALDDGAAEINSYLAKRYALPLEPVPEEVVRINCEIALYRLRRHRGTLSEDGSALYRDAIAWLRSLSRGEASIGALTAGASRPASPGAPRLSRISAARISDRLMEGF